MSDLARAIVDLGRAAEGRRVARRELGESVAVVARAITAQLRVGDRVTIDSLEAPSDPTELISKVVYEAARVRWRSEKGVEDGPVLLRGDGVLDLLDAKGRMNKEPIGTFVYPATVEDRLAFLAEVEHVVEAFRALLEMHAETYQEAAARATKLVIR